MEESLLSKGWEWEDGSKWKVETVLGQTDENGWVYCTSFGAIEEEGSATCGRFEISLAAALLPFSNYF